MVFWRKRNGAVCLHMGPNNSCIRYICQYNSKKMTDLQLFIIGCVLFAPVVLVMFTSIVEIQKPKVKNSDKPIQYYVYQIGISVLLIGFCVLLGILIFKY